jgi:intracellular septation protein A
VTDPNFMEAPTDPVARRVATEIVVSILLGGVAPYVAYVLLRPHFEEVPAILIASLFPAVVEVVSFARHRRLDPVSTVNLAALAISAAIATTGGSARFMLMKESLVTGAIGAWFLASLLFGRPAQFYLGRQFVTGNLPERVLRYGAAWEAVPYMRSVLRTTTAVWGIAFLLEVAMRIVLVFHVSTRQALAIGPIIFYAMMLSVIAWTVFYIRRTKPRIEAMLDRVGAGSASAGRDLSAEDAKVARGAKL